MPIALEGKVYENEYDVEQGRPVEQPEEPRTGASGRPRVYIRPDDNNASAGNVEPNTGIVDVGSPIPEDDVISPPIIEDGGQISAGTKIGNAFVQRSEDVLKGIITSTINAVKAPGDAMQGKLPMWAVDPVSGEVNTSPEVIQRAHDLAQVAVTGPAPIASKMADGTLGSFMGVRSKTFNKNELGGAQVMEANGVHPDEIFKETGMFRGADNRWRSEIPDKDAKFNEGWENRTPVQEAKPKTDDPFEQIPFNKNEGQITAKLPEVLDHPELYKAYPHLKDMDVTYDPTKEGAHYDPIFHEIVTGPQYVNDKSVYLHEIQHAIQETEGFARGGYPVKNPRLRFEKDLNNLLEESNGILAKKKETGTLPPGDKDRLKHISKILELDILRKQLSYQESLANYAKIAGEVESRNVQTRMLLGKNDHRYYSPRNTEDVHRSQQIVSQDVLAATPYGVTRDPNVIPNE